MCLGSSWCGEDPQVLGQLDAFLPFIQSLPQAAFALVHAELACCSPFLREVACRGLLLGLGPLVSSSAPVICQSCPLSQEDPLWESEDQVLLLPAGSPRALIPFGSRCSVTGSPSLSLRPVAPGATSPWAGLAQDPLEAPISHRLGKS